MEFYRRLTSSNWLIVFLILLSLTWTASRMFQKTFDGPEYAYYPPFGTIQTITGLGEDSSHRGTIDPIGGLKMVGAPFLFALLFSLPGVIPLLLIRLLFKWPNGFVRNVSMLLLTILFLIVFIGLAISVFPIVLYITR